MTDWLPVVDISRNQGAVNFAPMKARGVKGLIQRIAHGMTLDSMVGTYYRDALAAGFDAVDIGFYPFINPKRGTAQDTARFALDQIQRVRGNLDCFYMLDIENYRDQSPNVGQAPIYGQAFADYIRAHIDTVHTEAPTVRVIGYTNRAYWNGLIAPRSPYVWVGDDQLAGEIEWIVARYPIYSPAGYQAKPLPTTVGGWGDWAFKVAPDGPYPPRGANGWAGWQFSAGFNAQGSQYGVSSADLDLNIVYPEAWNKWTRQTLPPPVPPPPTPPEDDMIVTIFELVDSKAAFVGDTAANGLASHVRWSGPGDQKWADRRAALLGSGARVITASIGNLINFALDGPLPDGDPDHTWSGDEFANTAEIKARNAPAVAVDEQARSGVAYLKAQDDARAQRDDKLRTDQLAAWGH